MRQVTKLEYRSSWVLFFLWIFAGAVNGWVGITNVVAGDSFGFFNLLIFAVASFFVWDNHAKIKTYQRQQAK